MSVGEMRAKAVIRKEQEARERRIRVLTLKEHGYSDAAIAEVVGVSEGVVRNILKKEEENTND